VEVYEQIPLHTPVMLRAEGINIAGSASVKCVTPCGTRFILLLEIGPTPEHRGLRAKV
jgi:hypothetical protein